MRRRNARQAASFASARNFEYFEIRFELDHGGKDYLIRGIRGAFATNIISLLTDRL